MNKLDKKQANRLILLCSIIYCISYITRINYNAVLVSMEATTGISQDQLSYALVGLFVAYGAGQLISGFFGDRVQPKYLIALGLVTTVTMNLLIPFCGNPILTTAIWSVNGLAQAFMWPPLVKLMADKMNLEDYTRGTVRVNWGASIGRIIVYLGAAGLVAVLSWHSVFIASALIGVIGLIVWWFLCPTIELKPKKDIDKQASASAPRRPLILMVCLLGAIVMMGILRDGVDTYMPSYIKAQYNLGDAVSILTGVALPIFALVSQHIAGILFNKVFKDAFRSAFFIFLLGTVAAVALYIVNKLNGNVVLSVFLLALLTGCMHGVNMNLICILPPILAGNGKVSSVSGLLNSFTYVGSAISMYVIPLIVSKADWSVTIAMWIGFAAVGTVLNLLCLPIWKKHNSKQTV